VKLIRRHRKSSAVLLVLAAALAVTGVATAAKKIHLKGGNIEVEFGGGVSPKALPKKGPGAPVTLSLEGSLKTTDGTHISPVDTISLDFDKAGKIQAKGYPTCKVSQLESTLTAQAKKVCGDALVGTGKVTADIELPEQKPFPASGPLLVFNGPPSGSTPSLILHVYAKVPAGTTFVVPVKLKKEGGKYGTNAFIKVPTIVNGGGSVTGFKAKIGKKYTYKGTKASLLSANCPTGSLFVQGNLKFKDGTNLKGSFSETCTPKG
jgi:hypothetical protein